MPNVISPRKSLAALLILVLVACNHADTTTADGSTAGLSDDGLRMVPVAPDLDEPWGMDFLDPSQVLVTEKGGMLKRVSLADGGASVIAGVPESADYGQGGLLDVLVHRDQAQTWLYLSYAVAVEDGHTTRVSRGRLNGDQLSDVEDLFTARPVYKKRQHFGSRLLIVDDYLYVSIGDRGNRDYAQSLETHNGTVVRLTLDGATPQDNPFADRGDARPEIWTYGHRNPQGMARHPDGSIWVSEHGPQGGDELNRLTAGTNYGWPIITYGEEYGGGKIGEGTAKPGMEQPLKYYVPSIAVAGIDFYTADTYPGWKPSVLVSALAYTHLNRVELVGDGLGAESRYFEDSKLRFRDVQVGPDDFVYVLAGNGLYRVVPDKDS